MLHFYRTDDQRIHEEERMGDGVWVHMVAPTREEIDRVSRFTRADADDLTAALDEEESSRIDLGDAYTLILVDIPAQETRHEERAWTTIPLGMLLVRNMIVTVCTEDTPILQRFIRGQVREFSTKKRLRFVYQILLNTAMLYQANLRTLDRKRVELETASMDASDEIDLMALHELESTLVYFATSLRTNYAVIDRLTRYRRLEQYPDDQELLEDVIVETKQAIEMTGIYRDILTGTRELLSAMISNRMNNVMKYLTSITLVMAIPTVISGLYGMNVAGEGMPLAGASWGFAAICGIIVVICVIVLLILRKKRML